MNSFVYNTPTKVIFGKQSEEQIGTLIQEMNCQKVLIHFGSGSIIRSGLLNKICSYLDNKNISYVQLGGVVPNPRLSKVYEGIELCRKENVDFILAVGGGSVIDSAKAIGYGAFDEGDVWDFFEHTRQPKNCLPIGAILTISAAGSEMSNSCVITNDSNLKKRGCKSEFGRCRFALLNPELTMTLPMYQTQSGCVDIIMHTMERYFNQSSNMDITDGISEALMRTVIKNARILMEKPLDYDARAEVMWAGSLSHNGLTGCGTDGGDWACHQLEHELGGMFDVTHGAGLSAVWGSWARYVYKERPDRFSLFAERVMGILDIENEEDKILAGIKAMEDFYRCIDMPTSLKELGLDVTEEQLELLAQNCSFHNTRTVGIVKKLNKDDMYQIYKNAQFSQK